MNVTVRDSKPVHYLEDFAVGQKYRSTRLPVDAAAIKSFANAFDPQPFHLDEEAARSTFFGDSERGEFIGLARGRDRHHLAQDARGMRSQSANEFGDVPGPK